MELQYLLNVVVRAGIEVTIQMGCDDLDGVMVYNLHSGTKSGMYLHEDSKGSLYVTGRYGEIDEVHNIEDLCDIFVSRYQARNYGSKEWLELCVRLGIVKKEVREVVEYTF